jgi:hypothetical protein
MALPSWMYRDPAEIGDDLIERTKRAERKAARHARQDLQHKRRRIQALTRAAMRREGR